MTQGRTVLNDLDGQKLNRACQACRVSKVRCKRPDDDPSCARCSKAGRPCVPFEESNKRQKRFGTRPADDIQARLNTLTDVLQHQGVDTSATSNNTAERTTGPHTQSVTALLRANRTAVSPLWAPTSAPIDLSTSQIEQSTRDIIDDETTSMIFDHFRANMLQHFPFMAFPSGVDAAEIRQTTPTLLLAILDAAGDGYYDMETSYRLRGRLTQARSAYTLENSADGMTQLQALIISVLWKRDIEPPQSGTQLETFQMSHAAANMAMEMGLKSRLRNWSWNRSLPIQPDHLRGAPSEYQFSTLGVRRTWLACYYICSKYLTDICRYNYILIWSSASLALQTPNLLPWNRQMDECLEVLSMSPAALASDKVLCAHVSLQHVLEEFETQLSSSSGLTAAEITHRVAKRQLAEWTTTLHVWNGIV